MALLDKIVDIDVERRTVTVEAGARVQQVVEALRPHGLTLENYASVREQQIGGYTQVSAHGTGARLPPVSDQVLSLRLITPVGGAVDLDEKDGDLFQMVKASAAGTRRTFGRHAAFGHGALMYPSRLLQVGLGALGVVSQVTLRCVPAKRVVEHTFVSTPAEVRRNHHRWLRENEHIK